MKASPDFVEQLRVGFIAIREKYGADAFSAAGYRQLFRAVHDSVSPGHEHNRRVDLPANPAFAAEFRQLKDAHIETAVRAALRPIPTDPAT